MADNCLQCHLRQQGFFCDVASALATLAEMSYPSLFPADAVLFVEGQMPRGIFVLCRGRAKLSMVSAEGKTLILRLAEAGSVLGLSACILGEPYMMTVETLTPCQVNFLRADNFLQLLQTNAEISLQVSHWLSQEYQTACRELGAFGLGHSAAAKVARFLLEWNNNFALANDRDTVKLNLTHEEMAQMIGVSRETVTRMLARFRERGLIEIRGANLIFRNRAGLHAVADSQVGRDQNQTSNLGIASSRTLVDQPHVSPPQKPPASATCLPSGQRTPGSKMQRAFGS